jgi:predicted nucleic acid-binding protein
LRPVFCNAGPLIALGKLNRLSLLGRLFPGFAIPRTVYREVVAEGLALGAPDAAATRLFVERSRSLIVEAAEPVLAAYEPRLALDAGERELLALACGSRGALVLLDDESARAEARRLGLSIKGTLGVLVQAHREGLLTFEEVELLLLTIAARPDIWISEKLCQQVLAELTRTS